MKSICNRIHYAGNFRTGYWDEIDSSGKAEAFTLNPYATATRPVHPVSWHPSIPIRAGQALPDR